MYKSAKMQISIETRIKIDAVSCYVDWIVKNLSLNGKKKRKKKNSILFLRTLNSLTTKKTQRNQSYVIISDEVAIGVYLSLCKEWCELDFGFGNNMAVSCADRPLEALYPSRSLVKSVIEFTMQRLLSVRRVLHKSLSTCFPSPSYAPSDLFYGDCDCVAIISTSEYNYLGY